MEDSPLKKPFGSSGNNGRLRKIVVIDDDVSFAKYIRDVVANSFPQCEIETCSNVFEAGYVLVGFVPDLVFLDIHLPGVEGYEICKYIKTNNNLKDTKVIAMTSNNTEEARKRMAGNGADVFLPKPIDVEVIIETINNYLLK